MNNPSETWNLREEAGRVGGTVNDHLLGMPVSHHNVVLTPSIETCRKTDGNQCFPTADCKTTFLS